MPTRLSLFISSPGDVSEERVITARVLERLAESFSDWLTLEPIFWEHEPMRMTETFQTQIARPSDTDVFICILWARLGTRLPASITREDGSRYASGTEFEFEDAMAGFNNKQKPDILIYRKMAEPPFLLNSKAPDFAERLAQKEALDSFIEKWFQHKDGSFKAAFNSFDNLAEFEERLEIHLRKLLVRYIPAGVSDAPLRPRWSQGSPFRGLIPFQPEHAPVFFGRTKAVGEVMNALRKQAQNERAFVMILGMSGSGKSSLVRAGILPLLTQSGVIEGVGLWRHCVVRPSDLGENYINGLACALLGENALPSLGKTDQHDLESMLRLAGSDLLSTGNWQHTSEGLCAFFDKRLQACAEPHGLERQQVRLLLVLDQMEELFTLRRFQHQDRHIITQLLSLLARSGRIWIITTFRSDFYHRCVELPPLTSLLEDSGQYLLTPPSPSEISQMIRLPAFAAGLQFEKKTETQVGLDELLLEHMVRNPNNLALLGFTLDRLYQKRDTHDVLIFQAYEDLGGLEGALAQHAEAVYQHCPPQVQMAFAYLMRTLITLKGDDRPVVGHRILKHKQPFNASADALLQAFIEAHLITTDRTPDGQSVARIAHEALLHYWPRLKTWILENQHLLRLRSRITEAAGVWDAEMRTESRLLPDGKPLLEAEELLRQWQPVLKSFVCDFIQASLIASSQRRRVVTQAARKTLRRSRQIAAGFAIISVLAGIGAYYGYEGRTLALKAANQAEQQAQIAKQERDKAISAQANMLAYLSHEETLQGNAGNGMLYALAALQKSTDAEYPAKAEVALYHALSENHEARVLTGHEYWVHYIDFSPDDQSLVSASEDGTARVWSRADGELTAILTGHQAFISRVHFSPDGSQVLTASADQTARLWSAQDGKLIHIFQGHEGTLIDAQFSPDGSRILTASVDGTAKLWDKSTGQLIHTLTANLQALNVVRFSADGQQILTAGIDNIIWLWDAYTGNLLQSYVEHHAEISQVLFQPQGNLIASAARDGSIKLWEKESAQSLHTLHLSSPISSLAFSQNGLYLAAGADNKKAYVWDITQQPLQTVPLLQIFEGHGDIVYQVEFSPDNQTLLSVSDEIIRLWNIADGTLLEYLAGHERSVTHARFSHDGRWIASTSLDNTARVWSVNLPVDTHFRTLSGHENGIFHAAYSPNGQYLLTASDDRTARLWDVQQGQLHTILGGHTEKVSFAAFSPDGQRAVTASFDGTAKIWHIPSGQLIHSLKGHQDAILSAQFSPDGQRIITASGRWERAKDKTAKIWDAHTGELLHTLTGHQEAVRYAEFSPSGQYALTASLDSQAAIWQADSGKLIQTLGEHTKSLRFAHFSQDNHWLVTASDDKNARLWRLTEEDVTPFSARLQVVLSGHSDVVMHAAFSPDNHSVLTSSWDKTARLWSIPEGQLLQRLDGHSDIVTQASFSPDGLLLATASKDGTAQLWRKQHEKFALIAVLNAHTERVTQVLFNPDNQSVATISLDGDIRLWSLFRNTEELIQHTRLLMPRPFSDAQKKAYYLE